jgi:nucleotide-binding universal stress UspA family protein
MPGQLLLALSQKECGTSCLRRASDLAVALGVDLRVIRVLPLGWASSVGLRRPATEDVRAALRATRLWLARSLGEEPAAGMVVVRCGSFLEQVAVHVRLTDTSLTVIGAEWRGIGKLATSLARRTERSVMVARPPTTSRNILAATDLSTPGHPVLHEAARLGTALGVPVTAFHNVDPLAVGGPYGRGPSRFQQSEQLKRALRGLTIEVSAAVRSDIDPVGAIRDEARHLDADLVVVGTHQRPTWERLLRGSVSSRVIDRTPGSVIVMPVGGASRGET